MGRKGDRKKRDMVTSLTVKRGRKNEKKRKKGRTKNLVFLKSKNRRAVISLSTSEMGEEQQVSPMADRGELGKRRFAGGKVP